MPALLAAAAAAAPFAAYGEKAPDLSAYDCTRLDSGETVPGEVLAARGFEVRSRARFNDVNLMMIDPKASVQANCFRRSGEKD